MHEQTEEPGPAAPHREGVREPVAAPSRQAGADDREGLTQLPGRDVFRTVRYRRLLSASSSDGFDAVVRTVEQLRYPLIVIDPAAHEVRFRALARTVSAKVVETNPGQSTAVIEFAAPSLGATGGSALVILPGLLLGAAVKAHDAYFARGFLSNLQRVLEGKGVGRDPARLPVMSALREKLEIGEP